MTTLQSWPIDFLTLEEWDALEVGEGFRYELVEGVLTFTIRPRLRHQKVQAKLTGGVDDGLPYELTSVPDVDVIIARRPLTIRIPDVVVIRTEVYRSEPAHLDASDVLLAVEILSDGTRKIDRILKYAEYAEAGIPQYWMVDIDGPVVLRAYALVDGTYELTGEHTGTVELDVAGHPITIDLEALPDR